MKFYTVLYVKQETAVIVLKILGAMGQNLVARPGFFCTRDWSIGMG